MANTLRFKRGLVSGIPTAALGEPLFTTDTFDLYIGNGTGNTRFQKYIASGTTSQILRGDGSLYTFPLAISSPSAGQVLKYNGTSWVNDSDAGITGSGVAGQVAFFTGATTQGGSNNLFWDSANSRLGIGTNAPSYVLDLQNSNGSILARFKDTDSSHLGIVIAGDINAGWVGNNSLLNGEGIYYQNSANIMRFYTNSAERIRLHSSGNLHLGGSSDNGLRLQVTGDGYFSGSVGIGVNALTGYNLRINKNITGSAYPFSLAVSGNVQSDVTAIATYIHAISSTQATTFTLPQIILFNAEQGTFGAGSTVTSQVGYNVTNLSGAVSNVGFSGNLSSGTGKWNLYMNGTANNYMAGSLGIGTTADLGVSALRINKSITGATTAYSVLISGQIQSDVSSVAYYNRTLATTQATAFTLNSLVHYGASQSTIGAGSTVTNQFGFFVDNTLIGATNNYGFYGNIASGTGRWNLYMNGSAANYLAGNLGIGITTPAGNLDVYNATSSSIYNRVGAAGANWVTTSTQSQIGTYTNHPLQIKTNDTSRIYIANGGNVLIGTTTDAGFRLDVNGTMRVSGASYLATSSGNVGIGTSSPASKLSVYGAGSSTGVTFTLENGGGIAALNDPLGIIDFYSNDGSLDASGVKGRISVRNAYNGAWSGVASTYNTYMAFETTNANTMSEKMRLDASGNLGIAMTPSYKLDVTGEARVSNAISIGTTPDTNKPFKILKNINGTVGINFENTSTGASAFSAIQMGTDVSGGTKFANLVYASSGVSASGVYQPDGTSLINNGSGGLNFLGTPIRFFTSTGNGTLRWLFDNEGAIQFTTTAPTTSATDGYKQYSADITAGNAAPHFRTENGAVIKLYQETTAVGNSTISVGGGNAVLDDTEFDGYTLRQIVRALRNQGILQ